MPPVQSKEEEAVLEEKRQKLSKAVGIHVFLAVCQHVITLQSEPMLVRELCQGDLATTARLLSNTSGLVGVLGLFVNQAGGKLSDSLGRKTFLMTGPLLNILWGMLVYTNPTNKAVVLACRVLRSVFTTFSNTVMVTASIADVFTGKEQAILASKVGATVGVGVVLTPIFETFILQRAKHPKYTYPVLSALAAVNALYCLTCFPETMTAVKQASTSLKDYIAAANPFGFLEIYSRGSKLLQRITTITTIQMLLEGKNLSDLSEIWKRNHLNWSIESSRNFVSLYGFLCIAAGMVLTPKLLAGMSARGFTSFTNLTTALGFFIRGALAKSWIFLLGTAFMLPGVNGSSATALRSISVSLATKEGFGKGEFSAWVNNLRALAGSAAPMIFGNYYAWCVRRGVHPGSVYMVGGALGALLPEALLRLISKDELRAAEAATGAKPVAAAPAEAGAKAAAAEGKAEAK